MKSNGREEFYTTENIGTRTTEELHKVSLYSIDKYSNNKMAKSNRLHNRIEPFSALFWALGIVLAHILQ